MTAILNTTSSMIFVRSARLLLVGASGLALSAPLAANQLLFTTSEAQPATGERIDQRGGLTQVALTGGGTVSIVDAAEYRLNPDGSVDLYEGSITVAGSEAREVVVRMPEGLEGRVAGTGSAANFSARKNGEASGHALTGAVRIGRAGSFERFDAGAMWRARGQGGVRRVIANDAQVQPDAVGGAGAEPAVAMPAQPGSVVAIGGEAGPVAAALNGMPLGFGDQLAAAGASGDIIGAARRIEAVVGNPSLDNFPSGDFALLVAAAARLEGSYGGTPFPQAQADIIRAYLRFLAGGGARSEFLTAYSGFVVSYLDLIRAGGLPSGFAGTSPADVDAYLAYIRRTGALTGLADRDRVLAEAYLAFHASGGNRDAFAVSFTDLTGAYFAFVRGGGDPAAFTGASQAALAQTIAFLRDSGLAAQLSAADRALVDAFLANGGLAFAAQYETALGDYFAFLASGRRPSEYTALDQATLRAYLETLADTGLLASVLGDRAGFYADYLAFLRGGGSIDAFAGLPANVFAGYASQLDAYFAFLSTGRRPTEFSGTDAAILQSYLLELQAAGALERFLGARSAFFADFAAFVAGGGSIDGFAGLPANVFAAYAVQLDAYFAFLSSGRRPTEFSGADAAVLQAYLLELQAAGALERFLGARAAFFAAFANFVAEGGSFDAFAGLPANVFTNYAVDLRAFFDFLLAGGVPSDYTALTPETISAYIAALEAAGATSSFLGDIAGFYRDYAIFLAGGGNPDLFAGLPVPPDFPTFAAALNAYALFLQGGGLPSDYTAEDLAQLQSFLDAVAGSGQLAALLGDNADLLTRYFAFLACGGDPNGFVGLPVYGDYVAALNAYYAFLSGGGLPGDYTALDQVTLNAYLDALAAAQGGLAGFGDLDAFFSGYFAFVSAGGDPANFAGLPVYGDYVAALNAYLSFLADGGLPSEYTVLDQATLNAYLEALANVQGGLAGFAALDDFFIDFFAFITGGGDPDDFAELPVNVNRPRNVLNGVNGWQFARDGLRVARTDAQIDDDGRITSMTVFNPNGVTTDYSGRDADLREFGRIGNDVAWTRYFVGAANSQSNVSEHLLVGTPATNIPATGTVQYALVGGTAPTDRNDVAGTEAYFTGNLGIAFGTVPLVGVDFEVLTRTAGYRVSTLGGAANPLSGGMGVDGNGRFENQNLPITPLLDATCINFCQAQVFGGLFGDGATSAGFTYNVFDRGFGASVQGVAIFAASGNAIEGLGTRPDAGVGDTSGTPLILANQSPFTATTGVKYNLRAPTTGLNGFSADGVVSDSNGGITAILESFRPRSIGTASAVDVSTNARFAIGRWTNGIYVSEDQAENTALSATQGLHYLFAGPTTTGFVIPTSGRIDYDLIAATAPTIADGSLAPGQFQADMAVLFGATNRVAMEGSIIMPKAGGDFVYGFSTQGGVANAEQSTSEFRVTQGRNINFEILGSGITTSDNSCNANCTIQFAGYFAGADINQLGLTYNATGLSNPKNINGVAIFGNGTLTGPPVSAVTGNQFSATVTTDLFVSQGNLVSLDFSTANPGRTNSLDTVQNTPGSFGYKTDAEGRVIEIGGRNGWFDRIAPVGTNFVAASNTDIGRTASGAVRWSRWSNGGVVPSRFGPPPPFGVSANGGYHMIIGTPSTNLPTSGRIDYTLVGGTRPTAVDGSVAPGMLTSGAAAVQFGASPKVGIALGFDYNSNSYVAQTTGGVTNIATSELSLVNGGFTGRSANGSVTGGACAGACSVEWTGFLAGIGGTELGVQYDIRFAADIAVIGTAAFTAGNGNMAAAPAPGVAPVPVTIAGIDMNRWGGTGSASPQGSPVPGGGLAQALAQALVPLAMQSGEGAGRGDGPVRHEAIRQAEQLMGGLITFHGARTDQR
ncbi:hypothetical protein [Erythrobacter sp.]|uniref:hypothetical protein n=1 Tax=Erythrobacter sp. TaxID=1042 RepID=UPI0025DF5B7F|nr:hypothetical protein [Erythrobacter sp.]